MLLCFELSMPNNNSWNGKWSGEGNLYARVRNVRSEKVAKKLLAAESWYYNFGDGWSANVSVKETDATAARKIRKQSKGFCGYDWMIDSIFTHDEIRTTR